MRHWPMRERMDPIRYPDYRIHLYRHAILALILWGIASGPASGSTVSLNGTRNSAGLSGEGSASGYFFIANDGDDNNDGTSKSTPWKTVSKVNAYGTTTGFQPGDSICFKGGDTFEDAVLQIVNSGSEGNPIVFTSYGTGMAHLTKKGIHHDEIIRALDQEYFTIDNLEISNPDFDMDKVTRGIRIEFTKDGVYHDIEVRNNYIHDIHGGMWFNRHLRAGIWMRTRRDLDAYTVNMLVENNRIERCHTRGTRLTAEGNRMHKNMIIRNNYVDNTGQAGILFGNVDGGRIEGNTVYRAGNYYPEGDQAGVLAACWAARSKNIIIQHNEVAYTKLGDVHRPDGNLNESSHDSQAFDIDVGAPGWHLIQYNYTHDNEGGFFLWMGNPGPDFEWAVIRYNLSVNDGKGFDNRLFELHSHKDGERYPVYVYNNTFVNDQRIWVNNRAPNKNNHEGWVFENNLFYAPQGQYDDQTSITYRNNLYWDGAGPATDSMALHADPLLLKPWTYGDGWSHTANYQVHPGSPVIGEAITESSRHLVEVGSRDLSGHALPTSGRSIGAHEPVFRKGTYLMTDTIFLTASDFNMNEPADSIRYFANDSMLGSGTGSSFAFSWKQPVASEYILRAKSFNGKEDSLSHGYDIRVQGYKKPDNPGELRPGMMVDHYRGKWYRLPDLSQIPAVKKDTTAGITAGAYDQKDTFALGFRGYIHIPQKGKYRFYTESSDGSRLYIGQQGVVDNDGRHEVREKNGDILLAAGYHRLRVDMFNRFGEGKLAVKYKGPGIAKQPIPGDILFRSVGSPPVITLVQPPGDTLINVGQPVILKARVTDPDQDVHKLVWYTNDRLLSTRADTGHTLTLDTLKGGSHTFFARAYDLGGSVSTSGQVIVTMNEAPLIQFLSPANRSPYTGLDTIHVNVAVSDENLKKLGFYLNGRRIKTLNEAPWSIELMGLEMGSYFIRAEATDSNELSAAARIQWTVVNTPPSISIIRPDSGAVFAPGEEIELQAGVTDPDDNVYKVAFYQEDRQIGADANIYYATRVKGLEEGTHTIIAKAFDKEGAVSSSGPITITVGGGTGITRQVEAEGLSLYPNPADKERLFIRWPELFHRPGRVEVRIKNMQGSEVYHQCVDLPLANITVPLGGFTGRGMYIITLVSDEKVASRKLILP